MHDYIYNVHTQILPLTLLVYSMSHLLLSLEWSTTAQLFANGLVGVSNYFQIYARNTVLQRFVLHWKVKGCLLHIESDHQPLAWLGSLHRHSSPENNTIHQVFLEFIRYSWRYNTITALAFFRSQYLYKNIFLIDSTHFITRT